MLLISKGYMFIDRLIPNKCKADLDKARADLSKTKHHSRSLCSSIICLIENNQTKIVDEMTTVTQKNKRVL